MDLTSESILHEDHHIIVVNKPAPLLTQAPAGIPSLEAMVKAYIKVKYRKPAGVYLGVPHRLDRAVSGAIAFTRNTKASQRLHKQFEAREVKKTYWAIVGGVVQPETGTWQDWIRKVPDEPRVERGEDSQPDARLAELSYRVIGNFHEDTILELSPQTGRMHQLRVQSAWRGHPILGDELYGSDRNFGPSANLPRDRVIALHARELSFRHPFQDQMITIRAPLPAYWPNAVDIH